MASISFLSSTSKEYNCYVAISTPVRQLDTMVPGKKVIGLADPETRNMVEKMVEATNQYPDGEMQLQAAVRHGPEAYNYLFPQENGPVDILQQVGDSNTKLIQQPGDFCEFLEDVEEFLSDVDGHCVPINFLWGVDQDAQVEKLVRKIVLQNVGTDPPGAVAADPEFLDTMIENRITESSGCCEHMKGFYWKAYKQLLRQ